MKHKMLLMITGASLLSSGCYLGRQHVEECKKNFQEGNIEMFAFAQHEGIDLDSDSMALAMLLTFINLKSCEERYGFD